MNKGKVGEDLAIEYLLREDFEILGRNKRWKHTEIDIVAKKHEEIYVFEVKYRSNLEFLSIKDVQINNINLYMTNFFPNCFFHFKIILINKKKVSILDYF